MYSMLDHIIGLWSRTFLRLPSWDKENVDVIEATKAF